MDTHAPRVGVALPRIDPVDATGAVVALALAAWTVLSASAAGGDASPSLGILGGVAVAYALARIVGGRRSWLVPTLVVLVAGALAIVAGPDAINARAEGDPLGYANANGALWAQAAAAAVTIAFTTSGPMRMAAGGATVAFVILTVVSGSLAATALLALVAIAAVATRNRVARKWFVIGAAVLASIALWTTAVLGAGYRFQNVSPPTQAIAEDSLSTRRLVLWRDAVDLMRTHPVTGVGPRRFAEESQIAIADPDTTETHNEFLQQGAETGFVGLGLLLLLFGWAFVRLARTPSAAAVVAVASVTMLAIHSTVDYVLHFPILPIASAALVGTCVAMGGMGKARPPEGDRAS